MSQTFFEKFFQNIQKFTQRIFKRKIVLFPFSTACCDREALSLIHGPNSVQHHKVKVTDNPQDANTLLIMGRIEKNQLENLKAAYNQLKPPKQVVASGACACSGGIFHDQEDIVDDLGIHLPVTCWVPGCPAKPDAILFSLHNLKKDHAT